MYTLCADVSHTWRFPRSVLLKSVHQVCRCTLYAHNLSRCFAHSVVKVEKVCSKPACAHWMHIFCKQRAYFDAYSWVYFDLVLGRRYFRAIEMSYTLFATCFINKIRVQKIKLSAHAHHMHTLIWCMHTLFGRMHILFRHWKPHLFSRVLQTPSQLLLV